MHDTVLISGALFAQNYSRPGDLVVDVGGLDVNGSLRQFFPDTVYKSIDICPGKGVDIVINPGDNLPFEDESVDIILSTSCFEHDPVFWMTFREMCRVIKKTGYIYVSAPSNGIYHCHPGDNWRFYTDAGQALAYWSGKVSYPVKVVECFHLYPISDLWIDFICIWKRTDVPETSITLGNDIKSNVGLLKKSLLDKGCRIGSSYIDVVCHVNFDWEYYLDKNPDLRANGITTEESAKLHWLTYGIKEHRIYNREF